MSSSITFGQNEYQKNPKCSYLNPCKISKAVIAAASKSARRLYRDRVSAIQEVVISAAQKSGERLRQKQSNAIAQVNGVPALVKNGKNEEALDILYLAIHAIERLASSGPYNFFLK